MSLTSLKKQKNTKEIWALQAFFKKNKNNRSVKGDGPPSVPSVFQCEGELTQTGRRVLVAFPKTHVYPSTTCCTCCLLF